MAKRPKYKEEDFPPAGTVFAAPTKDGRFSAGRILRRDYYGGAQAALVAASPWLGYKLPSLDVPELQQTLLSTHHAWHGTPQIFWTFDLLPADFIILGRIELSEEDIAAASNSFSGWQSIPIQALLQWRWDHDREAMLQEESKHAIEQAETRRARAAVHAEMMKTLTLDSLSKRVWFASWENGRSSLPLAECQGLIDKLIRDLRSTPKLTLGIVKKLVKQSVNDFNRLDAAHHHFISTIEREDLCEAYEQIVCAAKFPNVAHQVDQWREW